MKKKQLILFLALLLGITTSQGQDNLVIHLITGSDVTVAIKDVQRITFSGDNMLLKPVTGAEKSYHLDNITFITFLNGVGIHENPEVAKNIEVNVYVNAAGEVVAESSHSIIGLTLFDVTGKLVSMTTRSHINVNSLNMGIYLLKIETTDGTVTKKFIKNR
jgi:hypothetical protein